MKKWDAEHSTWNSGLWGFINKSGQVITKPKFTKAYDFTGATCEVWGQNNKHILIDKKGNTVKVLTKKRAKKKLLTKVLAKAGWTEDQ